MQSYHLTQWVLFFFIYSFIGWVWECCFVSVRKRRWVNRGFMYGPMLPIYGFGALAVLISTIRVRDSIPLIFLFGMVGATLLEYVTGAVMERLFNVKYWDYSNQKFNLNGYICLTSSLGWGLFSVLLVKFVHVPIEGAVLKIPTIIAEGIAFVLTVAAAVDVTQSFNDAMDLKRILAQLEESKKQIRKIQEKLKVASEEFVEDYLQLNRAFKLYDKDGKEGQLTGTYVDKNGQKIVRGEDSIYFEYAMPETSEVCKQTDKGGIQNLPKGFALNGSKVVYEGYVEAPSNSFYQFILYYAGYMKVYIDGKLVVPERWRTAWNPNSYKFETPIKKGVKTPIRIEWQPDGDVSYCGLRVAAPRSEAEKNQLSIWSEMSPDMDYYFIAGQNLDEVISGYRTLTGKASLYPKWTLGFWQSRERYQSSKDIEDNMKKFRDLHIPVDNIVQDWNYWKLDSWGSHEFEAARYPNPQAMLDSVHAMNGKFMISVWPKFYDTVKNYKELDSKGWMYHQAIKDDIHDWLGFRGSFYDAYSAGARKMFWRQMDENLYTKYKFGIDAWWMDASEPNVRDCTPMWYRKALSGPTALGTSTEYFNAYSIVNADAIYNGQRSVNPNQRVFLLTRSGFAGEQRYSTATWSGDIATRWEDMRAQMTAGLNYSMAGLPFWGMDQGGFCVENRYVAAQQEFDKTGKENADLKEWRELQARWNQFGCFVPLYRTHGQWPTREVWNIAPADHPAYKTIVAYDKLRYRLMPYLYSMAGMVHFKDYTMMRGLVMDFNGDDNVYDIKDQWMFGPALMACPVGEYQKYSRNVYLPKQKGWYDFYTGKHYAGGQTIVADAPFDKIPVFVPEGSILPVGPEMEWSDQKKAELIDLYVYAGKDGSYTLYEDEGTNYNYEKGKYAMIDFKYNDAQKTITIAACKGAFDGMLQKRRFNIVLVSDNNQQGISLAKAPKGKMVKYAGKAVTVKLK